MSSIYARLPVSGHYLRKRLRLAGSARRLAAFALILLVTSVALYRLGAIMPQALIGLLLLTAGIASLALVISLYGLVRVWFQGIAGGGEALGGLVVAALALSPFAYATYLAAVNPWTNTAYTDGMVPEDGTVESGTAPSADAATSALENGAEEPQPSVVPGRRFAADAPRVYAAARVVLDNLGWQIGGVVAGNPAPTPGDAPAPAPGDLGVSGAGGIPIPTARASVEAEVADPLARPDSEQYRIGAVARDLLFALPSDISIRITQDGGESFVDMQSVSRSTDIDFGQNRRFIERFLDDLDTAMAGLETIEING